MSNTSTIMKQILLMEEILHHLIGTIVNPSLLQVFIHVRWLALGFFFINRVTEIMPNSVLQRSNSQTDSRLKFNLLTFNQLGSFHILHGGTVDNVQKSERPTTGWMVLKSIKILVNNGINYQTQQLVSRISEPSTT